MYPVATRGHRARTLQHIYKKLAEETAAESKCIISSMQRLPRWHMWPQLWQQIFIKQPIHSIKHLKRKMESAPQCAEAGEKENGASEMKEDRKLGWTLRSQRNQGCNRNTIGESRMTREAKTISCKRLGFGFFYHSSSSARFLI